MILEPPVVSFYPESPTFMIGSDAKISCLINNAERQIHQIYWFKNGISLDANNRIAINQTTLMISKVDLSDAGKYACKIKIGQSFIKAGVVVKVLGIN